MKTFCKIIQEDAQQGKDPSLGASWFHSKGCLVSSSEHPVVTRMRYFTSASSGWDVHWPPVPELSSSGAASQGRGLLLLGFWAGLSCHSVSCAADCVLGADPYVLIKCENQNIRSSVQHDTTSAIFDTQVIFYRKNIDSPIIVQVR